MRNRKINIPIMNDFNHYISDKDIVSDVNMNKKYISYKSRKVFNSDIYNVWKIISNPYSNILSDFKPSVLTNNIGKSILDTNSEFCSNNQNISLVITMIDLICKHDIVPNNVYNMNILSSCKEFFTAFQKSHIIKFESIMAPIISCNLKRKVNGILYSLTNIHEIGNVENLVQGGFLIIMFNDKEINDDKNINILKDISKWFLEMRIFRNSITNVYVDRGFIIFKHKHNKSDVLPKNKLMIFTAIQNYNRYMESKINEFDQLFQQFQNQGKYSLKSFIKRYNKKNISFSIRLSKLYNIPINSICKSKPNSMIYNIYNIDKYFSVNTDTDIKKLTLTKEAIYSISKPDSAETISRIIIQSLQKCNMDHRNMIITDATANVGGNVLNFSKYFKHVNAIEPDNFNYRALVSNINAFKFKNITTYESTFNTKMNTLREDIVFVDPPWGGLYYNHLEKQMLYLDKMSILEMIEKIFTNIIVLKLPINFDYNIIISKVSSSRVVNISIHPVNSFIIMIITKR